MILRDNFDAIFTKYPETLIFGEDAEPWWCKPRFRRNARKIWCFTRSWCGIREATIIGQGIGMALRGLRPIAEIQYLDYLLYAIQIMSDDLATLQYRTVGKQKPH
jgi:pyruvate/2-oxoglutarate/acetoin dehydrogenase E1 component